jgi:hypothetical protein
VSDHETSARSQPIRLPKIQLHKASGRARVTLGGRDHYLGPYGSEEARERYDALIAEWFAAGRDARLLERRRSGGTVTVTDLVAGYRAHCEAYYVEGGKPTKTYENARLSLRRLRQLYGSTPAAEFGPLRLEALRKTWIDERLSVKTINDKVAWVRRCFRWGVARELVAADVLRALDALERLRAGRWARWRSPVRPGPTDSDPAGGSEGSALVHLPHCSSR